MSFLSRELSVDSGAPIELYQIDAGLRHWYLTGSRKPIEYLTRVYEPVALKRSAIESTKEYNKSAVTLSMPGQHPFATQFLQDPPEGLVVMTIYRFHKDDAEMAVYWTGRIVSVQHSGDDATVRAEQVYTSLRSQGRRKSYSTQCNHTLFKLGCNMNDQSFKFEGTVTGVSGTTISSAAFGGQPDGYFTGGKVVVWVNGDPYNRRIESHTGTTVVVDRPVTGLEGGSALEAYPGCDHTYQTCQDKFGNFLNYGGFPWKPKKDPFSGSSSF